MKKLTISAIAVVSLLLTFLTGYFISSSLSSRSLEQASLFLQAHSSYVNIRESRKLLNYIDNGCIDAIKSSLEFQLKYDEYFVSEYLEGNPNGQLSRIILEKYGEIENFLPNTETLPPTESIYLTCKEAIDR